MAPLILRQAAEARLEAQALRAEAAALRSAVHANLASAEKRSRRAVEVADTCGRLRASLLAPSPWSNLPWRWADDALDTALVPLP